MHRTRDVCVKEKKKIKKSFFIYEKSFRKLNMVRQRRMSSRGVLSPGRRGARRAAVTGACGDPARRARGRGTSRYNLRWSQPMAPPVDVPTVADWECRADVAVVCVDCPLVSPSLSTFSSLPCTLTRSHTQSHTNRSLRSTL